MVLNGSQIFIIVSGIFLFWISLVTVFVIRMTRHYNRLTDGISKTGLKDILTNVLDTQRGLKEHILAIEHAVSDIRTDGGFHIQHVGLVRFNPFSDTGGSQSFTVALLDGHDNGLVMTSLYARTGNRWYVKEVREGKGRELELSKEEQSAIKKAQNLT
ncbi:MAG: DUF4446 family protein [bacterium]|nr:DUF4446 family protein [bacterium]